MGLCVGNREARADRQCGELIDRIASGTPIRELVFVEALGHPRMPFAHQKLRLSVGKFSCMAII